MNRTTNTVLLTFKDVQLRRRAARSTLYVELKGDPDMPQPVKIGRRTFFVEAEFEAWLAKKIDKGRGSAQPNSNP